MLDDLETISKIDKCNMLDTVAGFPEQIKETIEIINSTELPGFIKIDNIFIIEILQILNIKNNHQFSN